MVLILWRVITLKENYLRILKDNKYLPVLNNFLSYFNFNYWNDSLSWVQWRRVRTDSYNADFHFDSKFINNNACMYASII